MFHGRGGGCWLLGIFAVALGAGILITANFSGGSSVVSGSVRTDRVRLRLLQALAEKGAISMNIVVWKSPKALRGILRAAVRRQSRRVRSRHNDGPPGIECGMDDTAGKGRASKMELELKKTSLDAYETGGELTLTQEETAETIVPDYLPDIARIIETEGRVFLHSRELRDGKAEVSGTVRVTVLYTPEGEGGIRTLDFSIPFTVESDSRALPGCQYLGAQTQTEFLETRTLNPRKIFTHCKLVTVLTGYPEEYFVCVHGCGRGTGTVRGKAPRSTSTPCC